MNNDAEQNNQIAAFRELDCVLYGSLGNVKTCPIGYCSISDEFQGYRLANSIFLDDSIVSLADSEKQFRDLFDEKTFPHFSFFTYGVTKVPPLTEEARRKNYKEVSVFPIRSKELNQNTKDLSGFQFVEINDEAHWKAYRNFLKKTYVNHKWMNSIFPAMALRMSRNPSIRRFILIEGQTVIGTLCLIHHDGFVRLENVVIRPDFRRKGLGTILMGFAEKFAKEIWDGHTLILTSALTKAADKLYSQHTFQIVGHKAEIQDYS